MKFPESFLFQFLLRRINQPVDSTFTIKRDKNSSKHPFHQTYLMSFKFSYGKFQQYLVPSFIQMHLQGRTSHEVLIPQGYLIIQHSMVGCPHRRKYLGVIQPDTTSFIIPLTGRRRQIFLGTSIVLKLCPQTNLLAFGRINPSICIRRMISSGSL